MQFIWFIPTVVNSWITDVDNKNQTQRRHLMSHYADDADEVLREAVLEDNPSENDTVHIKLKYSFV